MSNKQKLPQEGKQLTAEEILDITPGVRFDGPYGPFITAMKRYAKQQTAWKDARIAELEENYRQLVEDRDDYKTKLEVKSTMAENLGAKVAAAADYFNQNAREVDEEFLGQMMMPESLFIFCLQQYAQEQTAALREELEIATQEIARLQCLHLSPLIEQGDKAIKEIKKRSKILAELEAVKKERDEQKEKHIKQYSNLVETVAKFQTQLSEVTCQRDEAVDIASELLSQLKYVQEKFIQTGSTPGVITQCETRLSRLSSGETKPLDTRPVCEQCGSMLGSPEPRDGIVLCRGCYRQNL